MVNRGVRGENPDMPPGSRSQTVPPQAYFVGSAVFHYLGPAFAVLLFARVAPLGVAWLRIVSAAIVFALWRRPWRTLRHADRATVRLVAGLGVVLAVMNSCFYEAIARLPLGTVSAIEFLPVIVLAAMGVRSPRNGLALGLAVAGVYALVAVQLRGEPVGVALAFGNAGLFALYIVLAHRVSRARGGARHRRARRCDAGRGAGEQRDRGLGGGPAPARPGRDRRGDRRRHHLLGDPLRV